MAFDRFGGGLPGLENAQHSKKLGLRNKMGLK
jgi:hypothetical protein